MHITNHYLDLEPVVRRLAAEVGYMAERHESESSGGGHHYATRYMVLTLLPADVRKTAATNEHLCPLLTDHYSNLWQV